jgi:hydrogenase nickel incorporation protein HypA/HybF
MHELSVTQSILEIALRHAAQANAGRIVDLYLVIGEMSSIVDDSVQFYWQIISQGTPAEGSTLHFRRVEAQFGCRACNHTYRLREGLACPACDSGDVRLLAGDEFHLESIEVSTAESAGPGAAGVLL